jgi:hypothetical protein
VNFLFFFKKNIKKRKEKEIEKTNIFNTFIV